MMGRLSSAKLPADDDAPAFFEAVREAGFSGELSLELADRIACSTDNSIYQIMPDAVAYPRDGDDLTLLMRVAQRPEYRPLKFYPRGGGTSTNGQSLGEGIVVDTSRHMRRILGFDADKGLVRVEPGLVRDKLNEFLKPHGRFFAPHVSTTSRATLGGMVSNDSSGKGSLVYGKTSDHIESVEFVLPGGETVEIGKIARHLVSGLSGKIGELAREVDRLLAPHFDDIQARFPKMKRGFTGYNLKEARSGDGDLNLAKLVAGAEGTLGLVRSVTLRAEAIPPHTVLVVLVYPGNHAGLRAVPTLLESNPVAIEFVDDKVLWAALQSPFADDVKNVLGIGEADASLAAHFFEMSDDDADRLELRLQAFVEGQAALSDASLRPISIRTVRDGGQIARVWEIRKACQGLIAGFERNKRAVAFIEDCAVPPENLADFVGDLEAFLAKKGIVLGMYGHADVGCVHIRPLMNLNSAEGRRQIRQISNAVFALTRQYGGLLWGEHGKGLRGEYSEQVVGPTLFKAMRSIKGLFDPDDRMNPGKIARPVGHEAPLLPLDGPSMRGAFDEQISPELGKAFAGMLRCDGNGSCFGQDETTALCPSYKVSGDRRLSPKVRSGMLREWARLRSAGDEEGTRAITPELFQILDLCLACKACAGGGCPVRVDIPQMKALFLEWYYGTRRRPPADLLVANLERLAPVLDFLGGGLVNALQSFAPVKAMVASIFGLMDLPKLRDRKDFLRRSRALGMDTLSVSDLIRLPAAVREGTIVLVQDCFTSFYNADVVLAQAELVRKLGFTPVLLSYREGGKPLHVRGFLDRFGHVAGNNARDLAALHAAGFTLLGIDGATTLMYRHEYPETLANCPEFKVFLLSEWLQDLTMPTMSSTGTYALIQHCTERSLAPETSTQWTQVFRAAGISVQIVKAGCCGMSGLFGHEVSHQALSTALYDQNWRQVVDAQARDLLVATGYSCRSQVKRLSKLHALHPAQVLLRHWPK